MTNDSVVRLEWKCLACQARFDAPEVCEHCGTSLCPECKIANALMNVRAWDRFVSDKKPAPASELRRNKKTNNKPKEKRKPGKKNLARLMEELDVKM